MTLSSALFSSDKATWETPPALFAQLDREFGFDLDVCALPETAKCDRYFTPADDALGQDWTGICYMNPPYGRQIVNWIRKAHEEAKRGATVVCLVPARVDTRWWWAYCRQGEVRFLPGRLKFWNDGKPGESAPFPSAVVVFRPGLGQSSTKYWNWRTE